jgi:type IV secretion system protein VirB6
VVDNFASSTYGSLAGEIGTLALWMGSVGFLILILNMILQIVPMHGGAIFGWAVKFILVTAAASSWAFFQPIYDAINGLADGIAGLLLGGIDMASGLDNMANRLWENYDTLMSQAGLSNIGAGLTAVIIGVLAVALSCVAVVVIGISKIGLGIALGLAPIFIVCLLFKATSDLFASWTRWTMTFVMMMIMTAGILGVLSSLLDAATTNSAGAGTIQDMVGTLIIATAMLFFIKQVPSYASALAGSIAAGGISLTSAGQSAGRGLMGAGKAGASGAQKVSQLANRNKQPGQGQDGKGASVQQKAAAMMREESDRFNKARPSKDK